MNYNINTKTGMANAVQWTNQTMRQLKDGGTWVIPRSGTTVTVVNAKRKECAYTEGFASDLSIAKVLKAAGWTFVTPTQKGGKQPDGCH